MSTARGNEKLSYKCYLDRKQMLNFLKGKILDIGCNGGLFHKLLIEKGGDEVIGLDIEIKNYWENMVRGDAHFLPFKEEIFDSIFAGEIIEHLIDPVKFLKECEKVLKTGGILIITTPNPYCLVLFYIKDKIISIGKNFSFSEKEEELGHVYMWDITLLLSLIRRVTKFKIKECGFVGGETSPNIFKKTLRKVLTTTFPDLFSWHIYFLLQK
jgi:SAM-dependent methyltransferase